ncbi:MAG: hypothetical protein AB1631_02780 [Acidobacteriota bacterium]
MRKAQLILVALLLLSASVFSIQASPPGECQRRCNTIYREARQRCRLLGREAQRRCMREAQERHRQCLANCRD